MADHNTSNWRRRALTDGALAGCLCCAAATGGAYKPSTEADALFKPVAPLRSLMYAQGQHYDQINALLADGKAPDRTDRIRHEALTLAELANVSRLHKHQEDYRQWADGLRGAALDLAAAAGQGDLATARLLSRRMNTSCVTCHKKYQP